ncbi:MAG TPA: FtsH protease activity modulator HflK [Sphingomicrobium sp.]|nr:FtsH protease activity modulator HflK [Sphingomicrobium sp.]
MSIFSGLGALGRGLFSDNKGPWGSAPGGSGDEPPEPPAGGPGPWGEPPRRRKRPQPRTGSNVTSLDDWIERSRQRFGGGGGLPGQPSGNVIKYAVLAVVVLWLLFTTMHRIAPEERGVVTLFGRYSHTLGPGISFTLPTPINRVQKVDVENIREINLGSASEETLMLTGDQNIIDIAYQVRWNIRDPELYLFELAQPEDTIKQVAESAMRQVIANVSLQGAIGNQRGVIEARVAEEMQQTLNAYRAGVDIQGVAIRQADPPAAVNDAFKEVTAAQQEAESYVNQANAYALQLRQKAQGEAGAFDRIYEQYKLAPGVTKRRMYYETMERILQNVDKTIVEAPGVTSYLPLNELRRAPVKEPAQ